MTMTRVCKSRRSILSWMIPSLLLPLLFAGCGGSATSTSGGPTLGISASPSSITSGSSSTLTVTAVNATTVTVTGSDGITYALQPSGGTQTVSPIATTLYTAAAVGTGGISAATATVTVTSGSNPAPTVTISAAPTSITAGGSSTLTVVATNATQVTVTGDGSTYTLAVGGGTKTVSPAATTTYTATATGAGGTATATATVTVGTGSAQPIKHVIFMLQENHTFDNYFGMLNPYRKTNGYNIGDDNVTYNVDGIDDKLTTLSNENDEKTSFSPFKFTSTCMDDDSSDWLASYGSVSRWDFTTTRPILMDGFVHTAEGYAISCSPGGAGGSTCSGTFSAQSKTGQPAMGYYDENFFNYYYYMASQFAVSDRWFSPVSTKGIGNRIATFTGGTTQGLVRDPGGDDHLSQLDIPNILGTRPGKGILEDLLHGYRGLLPPYG